MAGLNVRVRNRTRSTTGASTMVRLGRGRLSSELEDAVRRGTAGADKHADAAALAYLPRRGGFAAYMARRLELHRSKIAGGVRLTFDAKGTDVARITRGRLRHPVHGDERNWVDQTIRPGFAQEAMRRVKADVDAELAETQRRQARR